MDGHRSIGCILSELWDIIGFFSGRLLDYSCCSWKFIVCGFCRGGLSVFYIVVGDL